MVLAVVLIAASGAVEVTPAGASTLHVTTRADIADPDDGLLSLREAVDAANAAPGTWSTIVLPPLTGDAAEVVLDRCAGGDDEDGNVTGDLDVHAPLRLVGSGAIRPVLTSRCPGQRVVEAHAPLVLEHLAMKGGTAIGDGGALAAHADLELHDVAVHGNEATGSGGGVWGSGGVSAVGVEVSGNEAGGDGGGIWTGGATVMDRVAVTGNRSGRDGGGIWAGALSGRTALLEANTAARSGGGARVASLATGRDVVVRANRALAGAGGGLAVDLTGGGELEVTAADGGVSIEGNSAVSGGGLAVRGGSTNPQGAPSARYQGAIVGNEATGGDLAPGAWPGPPGHGGGVAAHDAPLWVLSTLFDTNRAAVAGGGISVTGPAPLAVVGRGALTGNEAPTGAHVSGPLTLDTSVMAAPQASASCADPLTGVGVDYVADSSCGLDPSVHVVSDVDPLLGPLERRPGPSVPSGAGSVALGTLERRPPPGSPLRGLGDRQTSSSPPPFPGFPVCPASAPYPWRVELMLPLAGPSCDIGPFEQDELVLTAVSPFRLVDTRTGVGSPATRLGPGEIRTFAVDGVGSIPDTAEAIVVNLTAVGPSADTHLRTWAADGPVPATSVLNSPAGRTVAASTVVRLSSDGRFSVRNSSGTTDLLVDISGYYDRSSTGAAAMVVGPLRIADTRTGAGTLGSGPLGPGDVRSGFVDAPQGIRGYVQAYLVNVTAVGASTDTHLTVWGDGPRPATSTVNVAAGGMAANVALVDASMGLNVRNTSGTTHVVVDVIGYFVRDDYSSPVPVEGQAGTHLVAPARVVDTRRTGPPLGGETRTISIPPSSGVPPGASAVLAHLTLVAPSSDAHLAAWAATAPEPGTSALNTSAGVTRSNLAVIPLEDGRLEVQLSSGSSDVVVDVIGYTD